MRYFIPILAILLIGCNRSDEKQFLVTKIRSAAKLATTEVVITKIVSGTIPDKGVPGLLRYTNPDVIFNTEATIKLGVDLKKINNKDIRIVRDSIILTLPPVEILNFSYPHEKFDQLFPTSNYDKINNRRKLEILDDYFRQAEMDIRRKIKLLELKKEAETRTVDFLESFLQKYQFNNVVIQFKVNEK